VNSLSIEIEETYSLDAPLFDKKKEDFRECLMASIEEILSFSKVVLNFLELNTQFKRNEILDCPDVFSCELEDLFGQSARGIEDLILERFFDKIDVKYVKERDKKFETYVQEALEAYTGYY
jgi:hypothetical protein